jgi:hypothetical protein
MLTTPALATELGEPALIGVRFKRRAPPANSGALVSDPHGGDHAWVLPFLDLTCRLQPFAGHALSVIVPRLRPAPFASG